jgi:single-stranded DNA-binding protein
VLVEGAIQVRSYEGKDGVKRTVTEINVSNFEYVEKAPSENNSFADAFYKGSMAGDDISNIPF